VEPLPAEDGATKLSITMLVDIMTEVVTQKRLEASRMWLTR
jgi:hypothetical protein